jgi:hypothetical protein
MAAAVDQPAQIPTGLNHDAQPERRVFVPSAAAGRRADGPTGRRSGRDPIDRVEQLSHRLAYILAPAITIFVPGITAIHMREIGHIHFIHSQNSPQVIRFAGAMTLK